MDLKTANKRFWPNPRIIWSNKVINQKYLQIEAAQPAHYMDLDELRLTARSELNELNELGILRNTIRNQAPLGEVDSIGVDSVKLQKCKYRIRHFFTFFSCDHSLTYSSLPL